jgi:hypothetical protein
MAITSEDGVERARGLTVGIATGTFGAAILVAHAQMTGNVGV